MKKALIIGSTVVDVIVNLVDSLPKTGEDVHVRSQHMSLGGCAYNVSDSVRHFQVPYILFSPVGTGVYGYFKWVWGLENKYGRSNGHGGKLQRKLMRLNEIKMIILIR